MKILAAATLCLACVAPAVLGQGTQPYVAIHDSELTRALESMPAVAPTPTGPGTTGNQWWTTNWHYFVMPESMKEALRSDGTAFTVVGDSNITAGALLVNGQPRYPIMISLAAEAIRDDEIAQLTNYVAAGGFLFVGSSSFTRNTNGTTRGDFAFPNELGVHMTVPGVTNWASNSTFTKFLDHRLDNHIPTNTSYVNWTMPSAAEEISWGVYPRPAGDSQRPTTLPHAIWQVQPTNSATVLARGDTFPNNNAYLVIKQYGKGWFIYYAPMQPLIGHGGFAPSMYAYVIFKRAIEWAFESAQVPVPRLSPWPYAYDAAFMVRHDLENYDDLVAKITNSAYSEYTNGAKGDYYFTTGTLREDMSGSYNTSTVVANLRIAITNYGATIGPHNGGLKNPSPNGTPLTHADYDYWHWSTDEALDTTPAGYPNGKIYALTSLSNAFSDIESWCTGLMTNGMRVWVAPFFNSTREDSYDIEATLGVKVAGDQKLTPFPHWTLSTKTPNKRYTYLSEPVSDWYYQLNIAQRMEDVPSTTNVHAMVDFYYSLGGLINFYSHMLSSTNGNTHGGGTSALPLDYITYTLNTNLHPRVWAANAIGVYQWWLQRSNVQFSAGFSTNGNQTVVTASVSGAQDPNTAIEIYLPGTNSVPCLTVFTNGVVAGSDTYRSVGQIVRVRTGTAITNVVFTYGCGFSFSENFDSATPPGLPSGWTTSASGGQSAWYTTNSSPDSGANTAFSGAAATAGISELVSPSIVLPVGQGALAFRNYYSLQSGRDGGVLEIQIGTNAFTDIITAGGSFVTGGYNSTLLGGSGNSLASRQAWSGDSGGFITTEVNLPASASGQLIQFKWRCATDNGTGSAGWRVDTIAFTNTPPALTTQTNRTTAESTTLIVTNSASDPEAPPQALTYQLVSPPANASIDTNGVITFSPTETQGPSTNVFTTLVSDNGIPPLSSSNSFTVVVQEINTAPVLPVQTNRTINELTLMTMTNTATDTDVPANPLSYTLTVTNAAGPVTNASISVSGVITWTPTEAQGPSTNTFTTVVTDSNPSAVNAQNLSATNTFTVVVNEVNNAPTLPTQSNRTIAFTTLTVTNTATDTNIPAATLTYLLAVTNAAGIVTNAAISTSGIITWTPTSAQDQTTNVFTTIVSNFNAIAVNAQRLGATNNFSVIVNGKPVIVTNSTSLLAETCVPTNNAIDSGETVSVLFSLKNSGLVNTTNLVATLLETNGVASPSGVQTYGVLIGGGAAVGQPFTFTANGACGSTIAAVLQLQDGSSNLGTVTNFFTLGSIGLVYSEGFDGVTAAALPAGWTTASSGTQSNWVTQTTVKDSGTNAAFANDGANVGLSELVSPSVLLPAGSSQISFRNNYNFETGSGTDGFDGGVLEIKIGTNAFVDIITNGGSFISGGYNSVIDSTFHNPLTNRGAWSGNSSGFITTTVVLPAAASGQNVQFRWRAGTDTGNGAPGWRIDTISITGRVCCANSAPLLPPQSDQTIPEGALLQVTNTVTSLGAPANPVNYGLLVAPSGATIDSNGIITWTPTEAQGPSTNIIVTAATNSVVPTLYATNTFMVVVSEVNTAPVLPGVTNYTINELTALTVTNTATDSDIPANALAYSLTVTNAGGLVTNASISASGIITWTPTEAQGPSTNTFTTVVTDNGSPPLSATNTFMVVVSEVNTAPVLPGVTNYTINELTALTVTNTATDSDIPANALAYSLTVTNAGGLVTNASISASGIITWTPTEAQGPSTNTFTTVVTDNGSPPLSATNTFMVVVSEVNTAPVLPGVTNYTINELTALTVTNTATDSDIPANALAYSLTVTNAGGLVTNASISASGIITWTPTEAQGPSTNTFTTVVTDNGSPPLSATNTFMVVVSEVNTAPVLPGVTNYTINELTALTVTNTATDSDIPANALAYSLTVTNAGGLVTNASISASGIITWTPTEAQGPSTNTFTTVVTDNGSPPLSATNTFMVVVSEVNTAPVLPGVTNYTINELTALTVTNTATDSDIPANALAYSLTVTNAGGLVTNASISASGIITWTPTEAQGPSTNTFTTVVTDNGSPPLSATNTFMVVVSEVNTAPVLPGVTNYTINELTALTVTNTATDSDIPANALAYSLTVTNAGGLVTNASISASGIITWTPTEAQGPSTNTFTTVVTDNGSPPLSATNTFMVVVSEVNTAPVLPGVTNYTINELTALTVTNTATDSDIPANALAYSLTVTNAGGLVTNASISASGIITWTPTEAQGPSTNTFTTVVTDNGSPPLSATNTFMVVVSEVNTAPVLPGVTNYTINELTALTVTNTATDSDIPANALAYSLTVTNAGGLVTNASISASGIITWTPTEAQGPSTNTFTTVVTDNGSPPLSATNTFMVVVSEVNTAPVLPGVTNYTINELTALTVTNTATDSDIPANALAYSLTVTNAGGLVTNASISASGIITWTPTEAQGPSTNTFTTVVTDNGSPPLSATNTFMVVVSEVNTAPVLPGVTNYTINELTALTVTNTATDSDIPANALAYSLTVTNAGGLVTNASISASGIITWTPTEAQGPSTNTFTTVVTDNGSPPLSATNTFMVVVSEVNTAPVLPGVTNYTINELTALTVTNTATDSDIPANALAYSLTVTNAGGLVTNASISASGIITWTPTEAQGPSTNTFTTVVTDNGSPPLSATNTFMVVVSEVNTAPVLPGVTNYTINELTALTVTNTATDSDIPANALAYSLTVTNAGGLVTNASISASGIITWTPTEAQGPSTNTFTTVVTDNGSPPLSATNTFMVVVSEVNTAPVLPGVTNYTINELTALTVTNTATDSDIPANALAYSLTVTNAGGLVTNASISASGIITWTPTEAQGPSTNTFTTVVTDNGSPPLSATNTFMVVVSEVNTAPVLPGVTNYTINELTALTVTNTATDSDIPANALAYSLTVTNAGGLVTNASISASGIITWTPTEAQGPSTNTFTTVVTDNGSPPLSATNTFMVVVSEVNTAPVLPGVTNYTINELTALTVTNTATDSDIPANALAYSLTVTNTGGLVTNASISASGIITWTPTEAQGPSTNTFTTVVTDNGSPPLSATNTFMVVVSEVNTAPVLPGVTNYTINELTALTVTNTATDSDIPANALAYTLTVTNAACVVTNASISSDGIITWTPAEGQGPSTNFFITIVTDNGLPPMSATNAFTVVVQHVPTGPSNPPPVIQEFTVNSGVATITWTTVTNRTYRLQYTETLTNLNWVDILPDILATGASITVTNAIGFDLQRQYRVILLP